MAVDPAKFRGFREQVDSILELAPGDYEDNKALMETAFGSALRKTEELIDESRPPRLYVFGRSGAGKSSLINALANKKVADVGAVTPTTMESELYNISFPDRYASWDIVDSRGLFESISPTGDLPRDTVEFMKKDLRGYRPDILIHVMTPDQVRAGREDFETVDRLRGELHGLFPPVLYCLNKVDMHATPGEWPPDEHRSVSADVKQTMELVTEILDIDETSPFEAGQPIHGLEFDSEEYIGVVPAYLQEEPYWNVETMAWLIGDFLPEDARLQFIQAQQREALMRDLARDVTKRFAVTAGGIGTAYTPGADWPILTSLQLLLVGIIGSLSCRELGQETVEDYLGAMGGTAVVGMGARGLARSLVQVVPGIGQVVSGTIATGTTYAIGRSTEEFFFNDEFVKPSEFIEEGKRKFDV